ncbi:uncharacterized protein LOC118348484 [Juglans regia]|uniref:Uncharacterized protein LOC118348484 n=1 Tax=Juglans regia TaxID=51240 RepID=A0A6P9ED44_JUGRE|nr:uncharacterized protein LOC118348484 [Juglans regia]
MTANAYFLSIKRMADELALAGQPLKSDDIITYVLAGLGQEYDSLASTITSRPDPVNLEELYSLLLIYESRINHNNQPLRIDASANLVTTQPQQQTRQSETFQSSNHNRGIYRGKGRGRRSQSRDSGQSNSFICQINKIPTINHKHCLLPTIHMLTKSGIPTTGATHHLTNDMNNIHVQNEGYDCKTVSRWLMVQKNLLSVQHFCLDNNVFFEFFAFFFVVKDYSGTVLHRGPLREPLTSTAPSNLNMVSSSGRQNDHEVASGSTARDITRPQNEDSPPQAPLPSPPAQQKSEFAPNDHKKKK